MASTCARARVEIVTVVCSNTHPVDRDSADATSLDQMSRAIELRETVVLLGRFPALAGASATVDAGEVVLLRGPNGVGKTTFLRTCAGLLPVTSGSVNVLGHDVLADRKRVRPHVGLLGHQTHLYDDLTVRDNLEFWAATAGVSRKDAFAAASRVGLEGRRAKVPVERLSAGQRRRVALAVLVARRPRLWLLDEPHAGLDQEGRDLLDDLLREAAGAGATVVFASHELERAHAVADRVLQFSGGRILGDDEAAAGDATPTSDDAVPSNEARSSDETGGGDAS